MKVSKWFADDLPTAARIWAAAAGATGAFAPRYIADALIKGRDLLAAAIEGTQRATEEAREKDWPPPLGCEIIVRQGLVALVWEAKKHEIYLIQNLVDKQDWEIAIYCHHSETPEGCERVQAAEEMEAAL